jgi:hypothetical protein
VIYLFTGAQPQTAIVTPPPVYPSEIFYAKGKGRSEGILRGFRDITVYLFLSEQIL